MTTETKKKKAGKAARPARRTIVSGPAKVSPEMPTDGTWAKSVCDYLRRLRVGYERNTNRSVSLVHDRKRIEKEIQDAREADQPRKLEGLKAEHFDCEEELKNARAQVRWFGDKIVEAIENADQGELFEGARTKPTEDELLFKPKKNAWKDELIESASGLEDRVLAALKEAGITTWGELHDSNKPLPEIEGLSTADVASVQAALEKAQGGGANPMGDEDDAQDDDE